MLEFKKQQPEEQQPEEVGGNKQNQQLQEVDWNKRYPQLQEVNLDKRWKIGVDQQQVAVYVGLALVAGFAFGFVTSRYIAQKEVSSVSTLNRAAAAAPPVAETRPVGYHRVSRVLRADTIEVEGVGPIRMIGIETPDGKMPREIYGEHGEKALSYAKKSLEGQEVRIEFDPASQGTLDESGQALAYIYTRDGMLFNAEMIKQGHAFVKVSEPFQSIDSFRALERDAMQAMRGVWGMGGTSPTVASTQTTPGSTSQDDSRKKLTPLLPSEIGPNIPATAETSSPSEPLVYVSAADRMYHKSSCDYLDKKKHTIALSKAKDDGYRACGRCYASTVLKAP